MTDLSAAPCPSCGLPDPENNPYCFCRRTTHMTDLTERLRKQLGLMSEAEIWETCDEAADEIDRLRAVLQTIVDSHDARSELYTNDADCTGNLADRARAALQVTDR